MQRIFTRDKVLSFSAVLLMASPLPASASLYDTLSAWRSGSTSTSTSTTTSGTTSTSTSTSTSGTSGTYTYTPSNWPQALKGDLYLPSNDGKTHPIVLLMHGGAWQRGDKSSMDGTGQALAQRGYAAFSINYRFAPTYTNPAQLQDMQQAVRWLQQHATEYRLDMNRLATWGYSAGGHLSALLAVQPASDLPTVKVAIVGAGPTNLSAPEARDASSVKIFMGGSYAQIPALYDQASPMFYVRSGLPPFFMYHGTADTTVPPIQSTNFSKALQAAGVPVQLMWLQGLDHSQASGATSQYRPAAFAFLDKYINTTQDGSTATPLPPPPVDTTVPAPTTSTGSTTTTTTTTTGSTLDRLKSLLGR